MFLLITVHIVYTNETDTLEVVTNFMRFLKLTHPYTFYFVS